MSIQVGPGIEITIRVTSDTDGMATREYVDKAVGALEGGMVKTVNGVPPDERGNAEIYGTILDFLIELGIAPVLEEADGSILADGDGAILITK